MKVRKIESLKKNVYLIDGYDDEHDAYYYMSDCPILKRYRCLGKLKDLTEEQFESLVDSWESVAKDGTMVYENYKDSIPKKRNSKESFLSALEASGLHLHGNPHKDNEPNWTDEYEIENGTEIFGVEMDEWRVNFKEAEQNVFSVETLVFVEQ